MPLRQRFNQHLIHAVGGAQVKFALSIIEHVDCTGFSARKLHRFGDDGREHRLKV